jgi:hypothetical protein
MKEGWYVMTRFRRSTAAAGAAALLLAVGASPGAGQVTPRTTAEIKTPLHLLGLGGSFVVTAVETSETAPPIDVVVTFLDGRDRVVKRVVRDFGPGRPAIVSMGFGELRSPDLRSAVRAVVQVSRAGGFGKNQAAVRFELFDKSGVSGCGGGCTICPRVGPNGEDVACAPPDGGHGPEVMCPDGSAFVSNVTVE